MSEEKSTADDYSDQFIFKVINRFKEPGNYTEDISKPFLRPIFINVYPLFVIVYAMLIISGITMNLAMVYHILKFKLYRDPTHAFLINMMISDVIKCIFVLPISLAVLLIDNWIFGKFLCYFLPMLQDMPLHVSMMTYMLIAVDRYRVIDDPRKPRIPTCVCALGTWFFAVCIVLPFPIYTTYIDLEIYSPIDFKGLGMCFINLAEDMQDYMRGLFIGTYIAPLAIMAYLYVKASRELQNAEVPVAIEIPESREADTNSTHESNANNDIKNTRDAKRESITSRGSIDFPIDLYEPELDIIKETRTQKYLIFMVAVFAICLCPLMVLRLARLALHETYENGGYFDITYIVFVWIAFLPTVTTPGLYAFWQMSRTTKKRLRGHFRFSNRLKHGRENVATSRSEPLTIMTNVDQPCDCRIGSISGSQNGSTENCAGSMSGKFRGSFNTRSRSSIPSPDSLATTEIQDA